MLRSRTCIRKARRASPFTLNRVVLAGNLTGHAIVVEQTDGSDGCALRLECPRARSAGECDGALLDSFDVRVVGPTAMRIAPYLPDGGELVVEGRLRSTLAGADDHGGHETVWVLAERVELIGPRPEQMVLLWPGTSHAHVGFSEEISS
jgi:single-stranded DNA-binding protein